MPSKHSVSLVFTANANASGELGILEVPDARKIKINRVQFVFSSGTGMKLILALKLGIAQLIPDSGYVAGDGNVIPIESDAILDSGSYVTVLYSNQDAANPHSACVIIEYEYVE
jgi:hypothetical protein